MAHETLPVVAGDKDRSLQEVLTRLTASRSPMGADAEPIVTAAHRLPAIAASFAPYPDGTDDAAARGAGRTRDRAALHPSGRSVRARARRPQRRHDHADGVRQDALLQRAGAERDPPGSRDARAVSVSDQGARAGSARGAARALGARHARLRSRDRRLHLRRRHAVGRAARDSRQGARRAQQSRHGALRDPAAPSALGEAVREPALRRHRRAARVSRRVRQPPRQHPAAAAAHLPALRLRSDLHLLVGDDREPARAGRRAHGPSVRARREERRAARREVLPVRQSAGRQRAARHPALVSGRGAAGRARVPAAQPAADPLRAEPARGRDPHDLSEGRVSRPAGRRGRHPRLSRRLPAEPPARDRARPARRPGACGGVDQRARARHRHRRARRLGDGRLSGHDRGHLAARRPRRTPDDAIGGGAGRQQRPDRSVHRPQPVVLLRRLARARADQSRQPAHPARSREVRGVRAAVHERRALRRRRPGRRGRSAGDPVGAGGGGVRPPRRRSVELDERVVSGRRRQPAVRVVRQLRRRRLHAAASA